MAEVVPTRLAKPVVWGVVVKVVACCPAAMVVGYCLKRLATVLAKSGWVARSVARTTYDQLWCFRQEWWWE